MVAWMMRMRMDEDGRWIKGDGIKGIRCKDDVWMHG